MRKKLIFLLSLLFLLSIIMTTKVKATTKVLFVGNSKTFYNTFPTMFYKLTKSSKIDDLYIQSITKSGKTLQWNYDNQIKNNKSILDTKWDYVVLQEHTNKALEEGGASLKTGATNIVNALKKKNKNIGVIYNSVWVLNTSTKKQQDLTNKNYEEAMKTTGGLVSYSGNAFLKVKQKYPDINLYLEDNKHPTVEGSYLSACCLYATIYRQSPQGINYYGEITDKDKHFENWKANNKNINTSIAKKLQKIATEVMEVRTMNQEIIYKINNPPTMTITTNNKKYSNVNIEIKDNSGLNAKNVKFYSVDKNGKKTLLKNSMFLKPIASKNVLKYTITNNFLGKKDNKFYVQIADNSGNYLNTYFKIMSNGKYYTIDREARLIKTSVDKNNNKIVLNVKENEGIKKLMVYDLNNKGKQVLAKTNLKSGTNTITIDLSKLENAFGKYQLRLYSLDGGKYNMASNRKITILEE